MPRMYTGLKLDVDLVAKSFFTSRVFTYGERFLLKYVGLYPEPEFPLVKRFEVGETAAREIQAVIGRRGGQIRIGATSTRVQHNRQDVTPDSHITFNLQY